MDTATLIAIDAVLSERSVRGAARLLGRPASTIAASIARFEAEISIHLVERAGSGLVASLEAVRLEPEITAAAALARAISPIHAIKLDALERFSSVANLGSIRRAARSMGLGQPQLTRQIAQLEASLGCSLLQRGSGGSSVTPEGARIAVAADALLAAWRRLSGASEERFRKTAATARLGSIIPLGYESEIARLLANLTARWLAERPRAPLFVSSTTAEDLLAGLKTGLFDVAFLDTERLPPDLEGEIVGRTPLAVVGVAEGYHSIADALLTAPLAVPSPRSGLRQRINRILDEHLNETERSAIRLIEIDSIPVILNLVLHHGFVSVLPQASVTRIRSDLRQLALPPQYDMNFWLCWPYGNAAIGRAILATLGPPPQ
ncbi:LysR family transcriptional regulator [Devosia sp. SL43]|uniref:LysR family transcriptional regulator n=1 Tax=Devosia sp. SL43 TaxID=2806348 RepID=UPI001F3BBFAD|nr:LysR family transcriptional regulator [Devosia sp. SL43]UJW85458.1 LysR family transcriptional regulator [Devosia sp. SL43]